MESSGTNQFNKFKRKNILAKRLPEIKDLPYQYRLSYLLRGSLIGDDDAVTRDNYSVTCKCNSSTGTLYELSKEEFMKLQNSDQSWQKIIEKVVHKEKIQQATHLKGEPRNFEAEVKRKQKKDNEKASNRGSTKNEKQKP